MTDEVLAAARAVLGADAEPLDGGYSGETFVVGTPGQRVVVRLYVRAPERALVDAALLHLVREIIPVPRVLEVRSAADGGPAFLVTEFLPGRRLDLVLCEDGVSGVAARQRAGAELGVLLARLATIPFRRAGEFVDESLAPQPWPPMAQGLDAWVTAHRDRPGFADWSDADVERLRAVARAAQDDLDRHATRACLVHSDLNPKNVLVDPSTGHITGVVDWEFAHAGMTYADLGNLVRFHTDPTFGGAVLRAFTQHAPGVATDARCLELARGADLFALVELGARGGTNASAREGEASGHAAADTAVTRQARALLKAIARSGLAGERPDWDTYLAGSGHAGTSWSNDTF